MNTETLNTFVQLTNYKNFTITAAKLYVAQSTVTNRISELEAELGKSLFIRNKKQLLLTEEGEHFLTYAKRILELENLAVKELMTLNQFDCSLRIGTTNTIYDCYLADKTVAFINDNPHTKINMTLGHSLPLIQMLLDKTIDLAFTYMAYNKPGIVCKTFHTDTLILVTSPSNNAFCNGIKQNDLATIPYYYCDFTFQDLGSYIRNLFPKGHSFPFEIDRSANLLPFLKKGNGYSFLPESLVQKDVADGNLIMIPLLDFTLPPVISYTIMTEKSSELDYLQYYINSFEH